MRLFITFACLLATLAGPTASAGVLYGIDFSGQLYQVSTTDALLTQVGNTGVNFAASLEFSPSGTLYTFNAGTPSLYTVDPATAAATLVGSFNQPFLFEGGMAFHPNGTVYVANGGDALSPQLLTLNVATGAAAVLGVMSGAPRDIQGLGVRSDGVLIGLDGASGNLVEIDPVSLTLTPIGTGFGGALGGMALNGSTGYLISGTELYSFDAFTGVAQYIGATKVPLSGLAMQPSTVIPEPGAAALVALGAALLLARKHSRR